MTINANRKIISLTGPNCSFANINACRADVVAEGGYTPTVIVTNQTELNTELAKPAAQLEGQVIGVQYNATPYTIGRSQLQNKSVGSGGLVFTQHGGTMPIFSDIDLDAVTNLTLHSLEVHRTTDLSTIDGLIRVRAGTNNLRVHGCKIHAQYFDPTVDYDVTTFVNSNGIFGYGGTQAQNVWIHDNEIYDCFVAMHLGAAGDYFRVIGNEVHDCYFDALKFRSECAATSTQINWNTIYRIFGVDRGGSGQPHADGIQFVGLYNNLSGLEIIGNIIFLGAVNANGENQGIFCDLATSPSGQQATFISPVIKGNLLIGGGNGYNRIAMRPVDSAVVIGNTVVCADPTTGLSYGIRIGETYSGLTTTYGMHTIKNNTAISYTIGGSPTSTNNDTWTTGTSAYTDRFDGPTFAGLNSRTSALAAFSMKSGGTLDQTINIGAVGSGYVNYTARTINETME